MSSEVEIVTSFFLFGLSSLGIASAFGEQAKGQQMFFIGTGWLLGLMGLAAAYTVAASAGYPGIRSVAFGGLTIGIPSLMAWFIYVTVKTFTDIGKDKFSWVGNR